MLGSWGVFEKSRRFPRNFFPLLHIRCFQYPRQGSSFSFSNGRWWNLVAYANIGILLEMMLWDSFSYYISCTQFDVLKSKKMEYVSRRRNKYQGTYLFTLDWANEESNATPSNFSENPGQHKCGHFIRLDNGNFAIQPNNRIFLNDPSFCTKRGKMLIQRKLNTYDWTVENNWKWVTEDSDNYHYEVKNEEPQVQSDNTNTQPKVSE
jgi:hypothetical protein